MPNLDQAISVTHTGIQKKVKNKICKTRYHGKNSTLRNRIMYYNGLFEMDYSANT